MHTSFSTLAAISIAILLVFAASPLRAADPVVAYTDDFETVRGNRVTSASDPTDDNTREIYLFTSDSIAGGKLLITAVEDDKTMGPDGKPGVIALSYETVPISADYSGFVYAGRKDDPIKLTVFESDTRQDQLKNVSISFRYKAVNANASRLGAAYNFRIETDVPESYEYRIDFGTLSANDKWQTFNKTLSDGTNSGQFLSAVNGSPEAPLKLVWGQEGEVSSYDNGDTILIDDIKITVTK